MSFGFITQKLGCKRYNSVFGPTFLLITQLFPAQNQHCFKTQAFFWQKLGKDWKAKNWKQRMVFTTWFTKKLHIWKSVFYGSNADFIIRTSVDYSFVSLNYSIMTFYIEPEFHPMEMITLKDGSQIHRKDLLSTRGVKEHSCPVAGCTSLLKTGASWTVCYLL